MIALHSRVYNTFLFFVATIILPFVISACSNSAPTNNNTITDTIPLGNPSYGVRIIRMMPYVNDEGDSGVENWTLKNFHDTAVNMAGWQVVDPEPSRSYKWDMTSIGILAPKASATFISAANAQFNNNGDDVQLVAPDGTVVQTIEFGKLNVGEVIEP